MKEKERPMTVSHGLARFTHDLTYDAIPEVARTRAKHLMLDAVGIAFASTQFDFAYVMLNGIRALAESGTSPVIGTREGFTVRNAVLLNAGLMHGLDFDDTHMRGIVHATAFCLPVSLGAGLQVGAGGRDILTAFVAGMEAAIRIGVAAKGGFHHAGFHATGLVSHFASALIAGRLYGLSVDEIAMAQGIAASTAAAVQVFLEEGAWSKRIHPGWGGVAGITAARLAQNGFVAPSRAYEGRYGFFETHLQEHARDVDYAAITGDLGQVWEVVEMAVKPYPVCHFLHSCAEAACDMARERLFDLDEISRIRVLIPSDTIPIVTEPLDKKRRPTTDYEAKFSAQYVTATGLVRGRFGLAELGSEALSDERILRLSERVECEADPDTAFPQFYSGGVVVTTRDGREHRRYHRVNKGAGERALSNAEILDKYMANATLALDHGAAERVRDMVLDLENVRIDELWGALTARITGETFGAPSATAQPSGATRTAEAAGAA